jgi:hydroxyacyl-ACP dehydratase HTD2-like protein with hotdog domain
VTAEPSLDRVPTTVSMFRFSAVTWNAHRVHYDLEYATTVEGHKGLLAQAYLLSSYLCQMLTAWGGPTSRITSISYRTRSPVHAGTPVHCWARQIEVTDGDGYHDFDFEIGLTADGGEAVTGTAQVRRPTADALVP